MHRTVGNMAVSLLLRSFLIAIGLAWPATPVSIADAAPKVTPAAPPQFHYEFTLRKSGLLHRHGLKVLVSGQVLLTHAVENGAPRETQLGNDPAFAKSLFEAWAAPAPSPLPMMCGAPRWARLTANPGGDTPRTIDLSQPALLRRWGHVVRLMERRLLPLHPDPLWEDCLSLLPPADLEVLSNPGAFEKPRPVAAPHSPRAYFMKLLATEDEDEAAAALSRIAWTLGADAFFAQTLVTGHRFSDEAREYLQHHAAVPALFADSPERAARLLEVYRRERGLDKKFYAAMLALAVPDFELAATEMQAYLRGLGRDKEAEAAAARIRRARDAVWLLNRGEVTWVRQVYVMSSLFEFWWDNAMLLAEPDARMPPLAAMFYANAFHFARLFGGDTRVGTVSTTPRARAALIQLAPVFLQRPWWTLPGHMQQDLIVVISAFSAMPQWFGGAARVRAVIPPVEKRVYELTRTRRFTAVAAMLAKLRGADLIAAQAAFGQGLVEEEEWSLAAAPLRQGLESGKRELMQGLVTAQLEAGLPAEETSSDPEELAVRAAWFLDALDVDAALALLQPLEQETLSDAQALVRARLRILRGDRAGIDELAELAEKDGPAGTDARLLAAELALVHDAPPDELYHFLGRELYGSRGACAFALLALGATRQGWRNADVFLERAVAMARAKPEQGIDLVWLLTRWAAWPDQAWELSQSARALWPSSSRLAWARAVLLARSGELGQAAMEAVYALSRRPYNPRYRGLFDQVSRLLRATPD
ncbi:hypothetical protein KKD52_08585 [Myxococcota bacterium]|nr:hypothetical protein [Myxococcota bacterium]